MKLLFDQNLSHKLIAMLADSFPQSNHVRLLNLDRSDDRAIWEFAKENNFAIVSFDSDFADLAALYGSPPKVLWLRCGNQPTRNIYELIQKHTDLIKTFYADPVATCLELH